MGAANCGFLSHQPISDWMEEATDAVQWTPWSKAVVVCLGLFYESPALMSCGTCGQMGFSVVHQFSLAAAQLSFFRLAHLKTG